MSHLNTLFNLGITRVTENHKGLFETELILQGNFCDEDVAHWIYKNIPAMYMLHGDTQVTVMTEYGVPFTTRFTREA